MGQAEWQRAGEKGSWRRVERVGRRGANGIAFSAERGPRTGRAIQDGAAVPGLRSLNDSLAAGSEGYRWHCGVGPQLAGWGKRANAFQQGYRLQSSCRIGVSMKVA